MTNFGSYETYKYKSDNVKRGLNRKESAFIDSVFKKAIAVDTDKLVLEIPFHNEDGYYEFERDTFKLLKVFPAINSSYKVVRVSIKTTKPSIDKGYIVDFFEEMMKHPFYEDLEEIELVYKDDGEDVYYKVIGDCLKKFEKLSSLTLNNQASSSISKMLAAPIEAKRLNKFIDVYLMGNKKLDTFICSQMMYLESREALVRKVTNGTLVVYMGMPEYKELFSQAFISEHVCICTEHVFLRDDYDRLLLSAYIQEPELLKLIESMDKYGMSRISVVDSELYKNYSEFSLDTVNKLLDAMARNSGSIQYFMFDYPIVDENISSLANFVKSNFNLKELAFGDFRVSANALAEFYESVQYLDGLERLSLNYEHVKRDDDVVDMTVDLIKSSTIKLVDIGKIKRVELNKLDNALSIPVDERVIPVHSKTKSAAKSMKMSAFT